MPGCWAIGEAGERDRFPEDAGLCVCVRQRETRDRDRDRQPPSFTTVMYSRGLQVGWGCGRDLGSESLLVPTPNYQTMALGRLPP